MKFSCDQCKTRYSIGDERVRGKVLKIRCKHCSHIMTVREERKAASGERRGALDRAMDQAFADSPAQAFQGSDHTLIGVPNLLFPSGDTPELETEEWHLSVDGVAAGPFVLSRLAGRIIDERAAGEHEIFVWRDGFDDWLPPEDVQEVWGAVERLRPGLVRSAGPPPAPPPEPKHPALSTHPVERVESFEFAEQEAPTVTRPRPAALQALTASLPPPMPRSLDEEFGPLVPPAGSHQFNITEPSQVFDLALLAGAPVAQQPVPAGPPQGADTGALPGPPAPAPPPVLVVPGPAPTPLRQLKLVLSLSVAMCVFLIAVVAYLLLRRPAPGPAPEHAASPSPGAGPEGREVKDTPVAVHGEEPGQGAAAPATPSASGAEPAARKGSNGRRPLRLPAAASGKTQLEGNAATLAKLYEEGKGIAPRLPADSPAAASGGGVSEAELQETMRRNRKSLSPCYDRFLKRDASVRQGRIDVQVRVGASGSVTQVNLGSALGSTELGGCMQKVIRAWHFPPADSEYETHFPLILTAN